VSSTWSTLLSSGGSSTRSQPSAAESDDPNNGLPCPALPSPAHLPSLAADPLVAGWSMLSSNALSIWNTATVATSNLVQTLTEEEDFKFPRPDSSPASAAAAAPPPAPVAASPSRPPQPPRAARASSGTPLAPTAAPAPTQPSLLDLDMAPHRSHSSPALSSSSAQSPYSGSAVRTAPSSGSGTKGGAKKLEVQSDDDFFAAFGVN
jgi:hypothetical protein